MTKQTAFIPLLRSFDESSPIGYVDVTDENVILKVNTKVEKIKVEDINAGKFAFAPSYIVTGEKDGFVTEIALDSFSLVALKK